jgi:hypothetical protein
MHTLKLSPKEVEILLSWYRYSSEDSQHYGDGITLFPVEQAILSKLNALEGKRLFTDNDICIIAEWMEKAINRKYGKATFLLPEERRIYMEIKELMQRIKP